MSILPRKRTTTQAHPASQPFVPLHFGPAPYAHAPTIHARAEQLCLSLMPTQRSVLARISGSTILGSAEPYMPASAEEAAAVQALAHPMYGLVTAETHGYVSTYQLTKLGRLVLQRFLLAAIGELPLPGNAYASR